jgi:cytoskeletal protein CcmA (bactofilin family)
MTDKEKDSLEESSQIIKPNIEGEKSESSTIVHESESLADTDTSHEPSPGEVTKNPNTLDRLKSFLNLYFVLFIVALILSIGGIIAGLKFTNVSTGNNPQKTGSLTDKQIADLKGNTTIVGDSQQVLDIQGNSVFEGQVLMRKNLDVAGSIKVGGSLSLPAITVGGTSSFGQIQVNDKLSVNGDTTMQGRLNVQDGLTVAGSANISGALSAGQLNITNLQLNGDLTINRHITSSGGNPSKSNGSSLGGGGTASVNGSDTAGTVTINTGSSPSAGCYITVNFTRAFGSTPHVVISPSNSNGAKIQYYASRTTSNMSICSATSPTSSKTYTYDYIVID